MYGIPNMKLPKEIVARRVGLMKAEGVGFCLNTAADASLRAEFDAVLLCGGARRARRLEVPGESANGVALAVDYLTEATRALLEGRAPSLTAQGKDVLVVGGGDTGNDCVATCLRQGCRSVAQLGNAARSAGAARKGQSLARMAARSAHGLRPTGSHRRAGRDPRLFETTVERVLADENGNIRAVEAVRVARGTDGRPHAVEGTRRTLPCQLLLIAAGLSAANRNSPSASTFPSTPATFPTYPPAHMFSPPASLSPATCAAVNRWSSAPLADGRAAAMEAHRYLGGAAL